MWFVIKRRSLGVILIVLAAAVLLFSDWNRRHPSAERAPRLAILQHASQSIIEEGVQGMLEALAANGFVDGKTITIRRFNAEGDMATANTIARAITSGEYTMVLTATTVSLQSVANANTAGKTMHVFGLVSDPFSAGVGLSREQPLQHPRHLVGLGTMQPVANTFRLARRMFPGLQAVGVVWNPAEANSEANVKLGRQICHELGINLVEANVDNSSGVMEAASSLIARGVQALWIGGDVTVLTALDSVVATAHKAGIPVFTSMPGSAQRGSLFDLGADYHEVGRLAGDLAAHILHGADPRLIAVENVMPEKLLINRAALSGLHDPWQVPDEVLRTAQLIGEGSTTAAPGAPPVATVSAASLRPLPGRTFKLGLVYFAPEPGAESCMQGLFDGLRDLGYVEGTNLEVRRAHAQGEIANIPALLQNYDNQDLDLIMTMTTPCLTAACGTVKHTPVVFTYVYDPIAGGAGKSFTDHLPNVTGVGSFPPLGETVEMIRRLVPGVHTVGTLYNSSEANSRKVIEVARGEFTKRGLQLEEVAVTNSSEVFQAAQALVARNVQALWITGDNTAIQGFDAIVKVANDAHLPIINNDPELVSKGVLACVGIGFYRSGYAAATLAARVLGGANSKDVPIENVAVKTVSINLDVARRLGMTIPEAVVAQADEVIDASGTHGKQAASPKSTQAAPTAGPLSKLWKVDILEYVNVVDSEDAERGIRTGLRESGLAEGRDYTVRLRNAQGDMATLSTMVDAAQSDGADLLVTLSTPTLQAALRRARSLPIVFTFVANAVLAGAGRSDADHLPNVTGVTTRTASDELIGVVRDCLPRARRIGTLFVPVEVNSVFNKEQMTEAARRAGMELVAMSVNTSSEIADTALALCDQSIDAVVQVAGNLTTVAFASITQAARRHKLPVFGSLSGNAQDGAAVVVARDYYDGGRDAGAMAARIMRGESPASMPFQPLRQTKIIINQDAVHRMGLTIPDALRQRAAQVIGE